MTDTPFDVYRSQPSTACQHPQGGGLSVVLALQHPESDDWRLAGQCRTASVGSAQGTVDRDRCGLAPIHATTPRGGGHADDSDSPHRRIHR